MCMVLFSAVSVLIAVEMCRCMYLVHRSSHISMFVLDSNISCVINQCKYKHAHHILLFFEYVQWSGIYSIDYYLM